MSRPSTPGVGVDSSPGMFIQVVAKVAAAQKAVLSHAAPPVPSSSEPFLELH